MITPFMMNSMLHHVGMSWIISSKKEMDYDNFSNHENVGWFETGPWHNKNICSKLYGTTFEGCAMDLFQTSQHSRDWRSSHNPFLF